MTLDKLYFRTAEQERRQASAKRSEESRINKSRIERWLANRDNHNTLTHHPTEVPTRREHNPLLNQINLALEIHNREHTDFTEDCVICTFKAVNAVEEENKLQKSATIFLAKIGKEKIRDHLRLIRQLLDTDGPDWLHKKEYL